MPKPHQLSLTKTARPALLLLVFLAASLSIALSTPVRADDDHDDLLWAGLGAVAGIFIYSALQNNQRRDPFYSSAGSSAGAVHGYGRFTPPSHPVGTPGYGYFGTDGDAGFYGGTYDASHLPALEDYPYGPGPGDYVSYKGPSHKAFTIRSTQTALKRLGYSVRSVDGIIGPRTRDAIRDWQWDNGFKGTGSLTSSQTEALHRQAGLI